MSILFISIVIKFRLNLCCPVLGPIFYTFPILQHNYLNYGLLLAQKNLLREIISNNIIFFDIFRYTKIFDATTQLMDYKFLDLNLSSDCKTLIISLSYETYLVIHDFCPSRIKYETFFFSIPTMDWDFFTPEYAWNRMELSDYIKQKKFCEFANNWPSYFKLKEYGKSMSNRLEIIRKDFTLPQFIETPEVKNTEVAISSYGKFFVTKDFDLNNEVSTNY